MAFHEEVQETALLTTYSWRRVGPTLGLLLKWDSKELLALGDWQDRGDQGMPEHYAASKHTLSMRCKHYVLAAVRALSSFSSWDAIPPQALADCCVTADLGVTEAVQSDCTRVWEGVTSHEKRRSFRATAARLNSLQKSRAAAVGMACMPELVGDNVVGSTLRDGAALCVRFQTGQCRLSPDECPHQHRCACLLKTGRLCGGRHAAQDCREKRRLTVEAGSRSGRAGASVTPSFDGPAVGEESSGAAGSLGICASSVAATDFDAPAGDVPSLELGRCRSGDLAVSRTWTTRAEWCHAGRMELRVIMNALMSSADERSSAERMDAGDAGGRMGSAPHQLCISRHLAQRWFGVLCRRAIMLIRIPFQDALASVARGRPGIDAAAFLRQGRERADFLESLTVHNRLPRQMPAAVSYMATPASNVRCDGGGSSALPPPPAGGEPEIDEPVDHSVKAGVGCSALSASPSRRRASSGDRLSGDGKEASFRPLPALLQVLTFLLGSQMAEIEHFCALAQKMA